MINQTSIKITESSENARFASEIRGRLAEDKVVIAVEGDDDVRIDRKLFKKNVAIVPTNGKIGIEQLNEDLFDSYPRNFIAIKDADFDHLNGNKPSHNQVFLTDKHDMEMTMIDSEIVESIIAEYLGKADNFEEICSGQELIDTLSGNLCDYSYIKWFNDVEDCKINFESVKMSVLRFHAESVSVSSALAKLYENEANDREEVKKVSEGDVTDFKKNHPCEDLGLLICGHDFTLTMLEWLRSNGMKNNITRSGLESDIRLLYNSAKFKKSTLFKLINAWELEHDRSIVA